MRKLLLGLLLCSVGFGAVADWKYSEKVDEMRGGKSYMGTLKSEDNLGLSMEFNVLSTDNKLAKKVLLSVHGDTFDCNSEDCSILIRYGNGSIKEAPIFPRDGSWGIFDEQGSFIETARLVDSIFVEVPLVNRGTTQFKFKNKNLKWRGIEGKKDFVNSFLNIDFSLPKDINHLESYEKRFQENCVINSQLLNDVTFDVKPKRVLYCLNSKGLINTMHVSYPADKEMATKIKNQVIASRGIGLDLNKGSYMSLTDKYDSISTITIMNNDDGVFVDIIYTPNDNT
ncbi:hypothetical protein FT666_21185 [Providencia rettgeri]|uniref:hypothetical protein n=1 Tax=Providencia rettgeri TaxID=587 RepID=UPI0011C80010|nr:hypothetical protein [Providencia rettgeri]TXM51252.1 hypothetical protein FT667_21330 [Providencia rettgeri]TXM74389.1 hypothetical protein FT666_21185 [Providencia rettgeri]